MKQESGTHVFMMLDKTSQERLLVFGIMAATETANGQDARRPNGAGDEGRALRGREDPLGHQRVDCQVDW